MGRMSRAKRRELPRLSDSHPRLIGTKSPNHSPSPLINMSSFVPGHRDIDTRQRELRFEDLQWQHFRENCSGSKRFEAILDLSSVSPSCSVTTIFWTNAQSLFIAAMTARSGPGHIASSWMADLRGWNEQATNRDCKSVLSFGMRVRRSIFLAQQCICLGISDHELLLWIPRQASAQLHRVVRQNARRG
jgi:hypothetical protein